MSIGVVSDDDFLKEFGPATQAKNQNREESHATPQIVDIPQRGRKEGDVNVPDSLRKIIGETAVIDGRQEALALAGEFGISASQVSAYAKGATSTASYDTPTKSIISHINKSRQRAIKRAGNTLNQALSAITQEKLDYADADKLAGIAKDMSAIIKNLEPKEVPAEQATSPQFVIFAPQFRKEETFEVINVQE